ncbi:MAG: hypothetical protein K0Q73_1078 [Paenibacillus sp.]|jgi:hypothetical protein|nr:hypothetical protein [Paenibacillus sp.]
MNIILFICNRFQFLHIQRKLLVRLSLKIEKTAERQVISACPTVSVFCMPLPFIRILWARKVTLPLANGT